MITNSKPAYPEKMIAIATFQNLVLDKTSQEEIARQTGPGLHIPPSFGNTWNHKITLLNPIIRSAMIKAISIIPNLVFSIPALVTMFNIWRQTSIKVLFSRIIAAASTITGLKWLIFFVATSIIANGLNKVLTKSVENTIARFKETKENSILDDLTKKNEWWKSAEGKAVYERHKKAASQLERVAVHAKSGVSSVRETADFAHSHIAWMSAYELRNRDIVHIWDKEFVDMVEIQPQKEHEIETSQTLELANKQICRYCSEHVDKIADTIIVAQTAK